MKGFYIANTRSTSKKTGSPSVKNLKQQSEETLIAASGIEQFILPKRKNNLLKPDIFTGGPGMLMHPNDNRAAAPDIKEKDIQQVNPGRNKNHSSDPKKEMVNLDPKTNKMLAALSLISLVIAYTLYAIATAYFSGLFAAVVALFYVTAIVLCVMSLIRYSRSDSKKGSWMAWLTLILLIIPLFLFWLEDDMHW